MNERIIQDRYSQDDDGTRWLNVDHGLVNENLTEFDILLEAASEPQSQGSVFGLRAIVPATLGTGKWEYIRLTPEASLLMVDAQYKQGLNIRVQDHQHTKLRIVMAGALEIPDRNLRIDGLGGFIEVFPGKAASFYSLTGGMHIKLLIVNLKRDFFKTSFGVSVSDLAFPLNQLTDFEQKPLGDTANLGPDILRAANDIIRNSGRFQKHLRRPYMTAKVQEIVCSIVRDLERDEAHVSAGGFTIRDINRIHEARDLLQEEFKDPPAIPQLARHVGLNQTKLKAGFKATFNMTIYQYIQKCRMEHANALLLQGAASISEASYACGYDFPANFSSAYKRYYGVTPKHAKAMAASQSSSFAAKTK